MTTVPRQTMFPVLLLSLFCALEAQSAEPANAAPLSRLFIAPTGRMTPSGVVNVAFGGAFASQGGREYLGLFSVGLGGIAELEFSTTHLVTNILNFSEPIGTTALKFKVYQGRPAGWLPDVVLALRSNRWSTVEGSGGDLAGPAVPEEESGIEGVDFEAHLTGLYIVATSTITRAIALHGGLIFYDVRTRDLTYDSSTVSPPGDMKEGLITGFAGLEHRVNENTLSILELGGMPRIEFNQTLEAVTVEHLWYGMVGVRYFVTSLAAIDAGIRYRSDFSGLADAEIHAGVNLGVDIVKMVSKKMK